MNLKDYLRPGNGATDITPLLANGTAFKELVKRMVQMFSAEKIELVACVEGRGFILGSALAYELSCGLVPLRYPGKLKNDVYMEEFIDYSGKPKQLQIHKDALKGGQRILVIDDWLETAATVKSAIKLVERCGGKVVGVGVFMDDSSSETKEFLSKYNYKFLEQVKQKDKF